MLFYPWPQLDSDKVYPKGFTTSYDRIQLKLSGYERECGVVCPKTFPYRTVHIMTTFEPCIFLTVSSAYLDVLREVSDVDVSCQVDDKLALI